MSNFTGPITVRELLDILIPCLLPIEIVRASDPNYNKIWRGFQEDIDECDYADSKIYTDGTMCDIYRDKIIIWIE